VSTAEHREGRHEPSGRPAWEESWSFDALAPDGTTLFVRLTLRPGDGVAWYWAYVCEPGRGVYVVRDGSVRPPRPPGLEIRADGLWAELICETPFEYWSIGLEAFAVRLDDPFDAFRGERGERLPVGLDAEWELEAEPVTEPGAYTQAGRMRGLLLLGDRRVEVDLPAIRRHAWGERDWSGAPKAVAPGTVVSTVAIPVTGVGGRPDADAVSLTHLTWRSADGSWGTIDAVEPG
jgi:hypothetical protein